MDPIKPSDLKKKALAEVKIDNLSGLVAAINKCLLESYDEGKGWQFAYSSQRIDHLTNAEKLTLKNLFEKEGYQVIFDAGPAYDEKPEEIVVTYDTRKH